MVMAIGSILSGIGSIAGAWSGAQANSETNSNNQTINLINWMMRMQERKDMIRAAEEARTQSFEGTTDAAGNRIHYVPGEGWVTDLSAESKAKQMLQDREQMRVMMEDLPMKREQMRTNQTRQLAEGETARSLLDQFKRVEDVDANVIERQMRADAARGAGDEYSKITSPVIGKALRSGSSNIGYLMDQLAKGRSAAMGKSMADIPSAARERADAITSGKKGQLANLYNMFASRSATMPGVSYAPQNIEGAAGALLGANKAGGANSMQSLMAALGRQGPEFALQSPDDYAAKAMTATGSALGNIADTMTGQKDKDRIYEMYMKGGWGGGPRYG